MSIRERIVTDPNGCVRLLPEGDGASIVREGGQTARRAKDAGATFSANARSDRLRTTAAHAVVTRSEAAKILGVDIEEAAKVLDVHDVGKILAYDRLHVEAIAKALREHKPTAERTITVDPELSP